MPTQPNQDKNQPKHGTGGNSDGQPERQNPPRNPNEQERQGQERQGGRDRNEPNPKSNPNR